MLPDKRKASKCKSHFIVVVVVAVDFVIDEAAAELCHSKASCRL